MPTSTLCSDFSNQLKWNILNFYAENATNFVTQMYRIGIKFASQQEIQLNCNCWWWMLTLTVYRSISCNVKHTTMHSIWLCSTVKNVVLSTLETNVRICMAWLQSNQFYSVTFPKMWIISSHSFVHILQ